MNLLGTDLYHLIISFYLPYAVTTHYNKVYVLVLYLCYIRVGSDHLILGLQITSSLVLEVAQGSRKVETSVHPTVAHTPSCLADPIQLNRILWFMVFAKLYSF